MYPSYLKAYRNNKLKSITEKFKKRLESCDICPRNCRTNRLNNELGFCTTGIKAKVYSHLKHHGEEPAISGTNGSGTIFFTNCNLRCVYCQNYEFSQTGEGKEVEADELASIMLKLQEEGCHNINFVTPTHVIPQILEALILAIPKGLNIPLVYNSSGYDSLGSIKLLKGIFDIYLPDARYADPEISLKYSYVEDYPKINQKALCEMHKQVGVAKIDENGIIKSGLIIRHLVLPQNLAQTEKVMDFIARNLSKETYVSLMSQYFPCYKAKDYPELLRRITKEEYDKAIEAMSENGLHNGWIQDEFGLDRFQGIHIKTNL